MSAPLHLSPPTGPKGWSADSKPPAFADEVFFPVPVTSDRVQLIATCVYTRYQETDFGSSLKGLFLCEGEQGRFKLWGTVPSALEAEIEALPGGRTLKGSLVTFWARIERGKKDDSSGFFNRPTKARILVAGIDGKEQR